MVNATRKKSLLSLGSEEVNSHIPFKLILENIADGVTVQDKNGNILYANEAAAKASGFDSLDEFLSMPAFKIVELFELVDENNNPFLFKHLPGRRIFVGKRKPEAVIGFRNKKKGVQKWSLVKARPIKKNGEILYAINIFHDISDRVEVYRRLRIREAQQKVTSRVSQKALKTTSLDELFSYTVNIVSKTLGLPFVMILRLDADTNQFHVISGVGWKKGTVGKVCVPADSRTQAGYTLTADKPIVVENLKQEKRFKGHQLLHDHKIVSGITTLIKANDHNFGILSAHSRDEKVFSTDDIAFFQSIASILSNKVKNMHMEHELKRSEERFRSLVELAPDAIYSLSKEGFFTELNPAFKRITGWSFQKWIGRSFRDIVHKNDLEKAEEEFRKGLMGHTSSPYELRIKTKSGNYIVCEFRSKPRIKDGEVIGKLGIFRDVTTRKQEERERDYMLGIASHELKTPLATIKAFSQILKKRLVNNDQDTQYIQYVDRIDQHTDKLTKLIGDMLDLTRIRAGRVELKDDIFAFDEMISEILSDMQETVTSHTIELQGKTGTYIQADKERISRVILNVLSNAIKYSPRADKVIVSLKASRSSITVQVKDFGIGIPDETRDSVFEPFTHIVSNTRGKIPSVGLGLYISSQLVKLQGGRIWFESMVGKGTTFYVQLPINPKRILKNKT